ncbi:MAG: endopeptidase La [bacterium]
MAAKKGTKGRSKSEKSTEKPTPIHPLLPLRDIVVFPHMIIPFFVGRDKSVQALEAAVDQQVDILLCTQTNGETNDPGRNDIYMTGTLATILQMIKLPDGTLKVLVEGKKRAIIQDYLDLGKFVAAEVKVETDRLVGEQLEIEALMRSLRTSFENYVKLNKRISPELLITVQKIDDPSRLSDTIVAHLNLKVEERQKLLEMFEIMPRLEKLLASLQGEIEILEVERRIRSRVRKSMERGQKEYYLNEQMSAIQKELGEKDEFKVEILALEKKIKTMTLSTEAREKAESELRKLKMMSPMSAESTVIRLYLDWLLTLPWEEKTKDNLDLKHGKKVLDEDHYGLEKIKDRIIEYIAIKNLNPESRGSILCLVGPPGVGKTSLASSIARAMEKNFVRIALGGVRDEAEIRGHRRTYIGAMPGKIIQALKKANSINPLILLDEVDKMGSDFRGDPASAMLEVLDPAQNKTFVDHYLEVEFDLSKSLFICTANSISTIPQPLADRMEIIFLSSYTELEKIEICRNHLVPKQLKEHGISHLNINFAESAIIELIHHYTREAGVRNLEREIATLVRKSARKYLEADKKVKDIKIGSKEVQELLGPRKYKYGLMEHEHQIGVATGLAWTEVGGDMLAVEVSLMPGKGKLTITGKLGDVMQESAQAAYSYVRSRAEAMGLPRDFYQNLDIHIHVPEGATPKDGPSAGITMATALTSALTLKPVSKEVAMTGEITLRGHVLEIGGLKEKLLAAHRAGIKRVIIPADNEKDLYDVPKAVLKDLEIIPASHVDDVLQYALIMEEKDPLWKELDRRRKGRVPASGIRPTH